MSVLRRTIPLAAAACAALAAALPAAPAVADCCTGPAVYAGVKPDTRLTTSLRLNVLNDDPDHRYDASIRPYLDVGAHRIARLPSFAVADVGIDAQHPTLRIPAKVVRAAARYGARTHHRRAVLKLVVRGATDRATHQVSRTYAIDSYLRLPRA